MWEYIVMEWINGYMSHLVFAIKKFGLWAADTIISWAEITAVFFIALTAFSVVATITLGYLDLVGVILVHEVFKMVGGGK
ncbi:hypothetical protein [Roseateles sp. PN1]|uniref:hypothetical protein n=1 Tax=Roseateles sp. PN1 TaxID=3137372 RepID=UPI0031395587